jgi:hypothetical protein
MPAPPISALKGISQISPQLFCEVRDKFLAEVKSNPDLYSNEDIECIKANEWQIQRFILEHKYNAESALKALITAMRWRKLFGVHDLNENYFPQEYYRSGSMITYGRDLNDATIMIVRANIHKKISEWSDIIKKFFIFQIERIDFYNDGKGFKYLFRLIDSKNLKIQFLTDPYFIYKLILKNTSNFFFYFSIIFSVSHF